MEGLDERGICMPVDGETGAVQAVGRKRDHEGHGSPASSMAGALCHETKSSIVLVLPCIMLA
eukprot:1158060-Pelagomonas_calceolata.AAC.9